MWLLQLLEDFNLLYPESTDLFYAHFEEFLSVTINLAKKDVKDATGKASLKSLLAKDLSSGEFFFVNVLQNQVSSVHNCMWMLASMYLQVCTKCTLDFLV